MIYKMNYKRNDNQMKTNEQIILLIILMVKFILWILLFRGGKKLIRGESGPKENKGEKGDIGP